MAWSKESAHSRGYGYAWTKLRAKIMQRDSNLCQVCLKSGLITKATQVDHIKPKSKGGDDDEENLQAICTPCHDIKTMQDKGLKIKQAIGDDGWPV